MKGMTAEEFAQAARDLADAVEAQERGEPIQTKYRDEEYWVTTTERMGFDAFPRLLYRPAPPIVKVEAWVVVDKNGMNTGVPLFCEVEADKLAHFQNLKFPTGGPYYVVHLTGELTAE